MLPGQPFPVAVTVAAQTEAPCSPQPRTSDCSSGDTPAPGGSGSTAPAAAARTASQPGAPDRPPSASSAKLGGSAQQTPRQRLVTPAAAAPGMQWVTADMEYGRTVHMTLHREPPQPLPPGRVLSALLCMSAETGSQGESTNDANTRVTLLIVPVSGWQWPRDLVMHKTMYRLLLPIAVPCHDLPAVCNTLCLSSCHTLHAGVLSFVYCVKYRFCKRLLLVLSGYAVSRWSEHVVILSSRRHKCPKNN